MTALLQRFAQFIRPPAMQDIQQSKIQFQEMAGFQNVFGCIDGKHVMIVAPPGNDEDVYVNRKNFHLINVQIVCEARLRILDCVATSPGSFHDARILRDSAFWRPMEGEPRAVQRLILGDSAYPIGEWLMTPMPNPLMTSKKVTMLHTKLRLSPLRYSRLLSCCAILHNFAMERAAQEVLPPEIHANNQSIPHHQQSWATIQLSWWRVRWLGIAKKRKRNSVTVRV
ncbi:protein antagonist of like heterochromatin protein 1 [Plakobranchus ocellatus]|uniref:Protein antagonist of like heterochromatin protein 1 n=1 Tax=Plakobranchus ocellatus TaxID=259542 RepID=A0AAV3YPV9_9GAST|nr:protein antagonist of like heterochromatin protein 1 [Plakobranchus ocellatus]